MVDGGWLMDRECEMTNDKWQMKKKGVAVVVGGRQWPVESGGECGD
jgi:hypothetical protein